MRSFATDIPLDEPIVGVQGSGCMFSVVERLVPRTVPTVRYPDVAHVGSEFDLVKGVWRKFADADQATQRKVRRMYRDGAGLMVIAATVKVFAGTIREAAEAGRWQRATQQTLAVRVFALAVAEPLLNNAELANRLGCGRESVRRAIAGLPRGGAR